MDKKTLLESTILINEGIVNEEIDFKGIWKKIQEGIEKLKNWITETAIAALTKIISLLTRFKQKLMKKENAVINEDSKEDMLKTTVNIRAFLKNLGVLKGLVFKNISLLDHPSQHSQEIVTIAEKIEKLIDINEVVEREYKFYSPELIDTTIKGINSIVTVLNNQVRILNSFKVKLDDKDSSSILGYIAKTQKIIGEVTRYCVTITSKIVA